MIAVESLQNLRDNVEVELEALACSNHCGAGVIQFAIGDTELCCRLHGTDRLACEVDSIRVVSTKCRTYAPEQRDAIANRLVDRLSYLEERLVLIEADQNATQIRSDKPQVEAERVRSYFELLVDSKGLTLQRYVKTPGKAREVTTATLTRSVLCRLLHDMADTLE